MSNVENSPELNQEERRSFFISEIATVTGSSPESIRLPNLDAFLGGFKYLYFFTDSGFGKIAQTEIHKERLKREVFAQSIVEQQNLDVTKTLTPYTEISENYGLITFEKLSLNEGDIIQDPNVEAAGLSTEVAKGYAHTAAETIYRNSLTPIPSSVDTTELMDEPEGWERWVVESPTRLQAEVDKRSEPFLTSEMKKALQSLYSTEYQHINTDIEKVLALFSELKSLIEKIAQWWPKEESYYLVHNDAGIQNIYFRKNQAGEYNSGTMIDYEFAVATQYPVLGLIRNVLQFYAKTWANTELQQEFLGHIYELSTSDKQAPEELEAAKTVVRLSAILATLNFALFVIGRADSKFKQAIIESENVNLDEQGRVVLMRKILLENHELNDAIHRMANLQENIKRFDIAP